MAEQTPVPSDGVGPAFKPNSPELLAGKAPTPDFFLEQYAKPDWVAPWDIGRAQPSLVQAEEEGLFKEKVLDVGCGLGDNAIFLASRGHEVTAVDLSQHALDKAAKRAEVAGVKNLKLKQADMFDPASALGNAKWDSVLDSALLHCFPPEKQGLYLESLARHMNPGGRLVLFCMSDANEDPWVGPERLTEEELRALFQAKNGWRLDELSPNKFVTPAGKNGVMHSWRVIATKI